VRRSQTAALLLLALLNGIGCTAISAYSSHEADPGHSAPFKEPLVALIRVTDGYQAALKRMTLDGQDVSLQEACPDPSFAHPGYKDRKTTLIPIRPPFRLDRSSTTHTLRIETDRGTIQDRDVWILPNLRVPLIHVSRCYKSPWEKFWGWCFFDCWGFNLHVPRMGPG
jgi:hypothetical protein